MAQCCRRNVFISAQNQHMKSIICACITIGLVRLAAVAIRVANLHPVYVYGGVLFHLLYSLIRYAEGGFVYICGLRVFNR